MVAILLGIEDAKVLNFVEDEDSEEAAFGIMIETPLAETRCPICQGEVLEADRVLDELPATTAGSAHVLIAWKRRQWRCADDSCPQEVFGEENDRRGPVHRPGGSRPAVEEAASPHRGLMLESNDQSGLPA